MFKNSIKYLMNGVLYCISLLVPKSKDIVVCGGWFGQRFADNSKAWFLYLCENKEQLGLRTVVFVSRNSDVIVQLRKAGYLAYHISSLTSIWLHLRARFHFVDTGPGDINHYFSFRAIRINLWHGVPIKKINYLVGNKRNEISEMIQNDFYARLAIMGGWNRLFLLASSSSQSNVMQEAFIQKEDRIINGMLPRCVYQMGEIRRFLLKEEEEASIKLSELKRDGRKLIFYLPTHRGNDEKNKNKGIKESELFNYKQQTLWNDLNFIEFLKENGLVLVYKPHYYTESLLNDTSNAVIYLNASVDVYNYLDISDCLITDYSSIYFDYLLLKKPVLFYAYDLENYLHSDRGLIYEFGEVTPGDIVQDISSLKESVLSAICDSTAYISKHEQMINNCLRLAFDEKIPNTDSLKELWENIKSVTK